MWVGVSVLSWPLSSNSRYKSKNDADETVSVVSLTSSSGGYQWKKFCKSRIILKRHLHLRNRLLDQGYEKIRLIRSRKKFIFRYQYLVEIYSVSAEKIIRVACFSAEDDVSGNQNNCYWPLHSESIARCKHHMQEKLVYCCTCLENLCVPVRYSTWLPGPKICSDWLKFQRYSSLKLMNWLNPNCKWMFIGMFFAK
jgi:hypothetical protein